MNRILLICVKALRSRVKLPAPRPTPASPTTLARLGWVAACFVGATLCLALPSFAQQPAALPVPNACQLPSGPPPCKDSDGDGLCDSWELAKRLPDGTPLPDADPHKPDIYVRYDWMGYGLNENGCTVDADCPALWGVGGHTGDSCSGPPVHGFPASCVYACTTDTDCTSRGPNPAVHVGDRCIQNTCQHTHDPEVVGPGALDAVVERFASRGFNLHILRGRELPHSHVLSFRLLDDPNYPTNIMQDTCEGGSLASGTAGAGKYAESFYDLKMANFDYRLKPAYHYAIFGHYNTCDSAWDCNPALGLGSTCPNPKIAKNPDGSDKLDTPFFGGSGIAEIDGNDFTVTLGNIINDKGARPTIFNVGGPFMHELGHNLGLNHGGGSDLAENGRVPDGEVSPTFKPNYLSVMNYKWNLVGIQRAAAPGSIQPFCTKDADCLAGERCTGAGSRAGYCARLDYSTQTLPTGGNTPGALTEANTNGLPGLNEAAGLGSGNADITLYSSYSAATGTCPVVIAPSQGPLDYDGDGNTTGTNVSVDLNRQDHPNVTACPTGVTQTLKGHTDWGPAPGQSVFTYKFQCTPYGKD